MLVSAETESRVKGRSVSCSMWHSGSMPSLRRPNAPTGLPSFFVGFLGKCRPGAVVRRNSISCHRRHRLSHPSLVLWKPEKSPVGAKAIPEDVGNEENRFQPRLGCPWLHPGSIAKSTAISCNDLRTCFKGSIIGIYAFLSGKSRKILLFFSWMKETVQLPGRSYPGRVDTENSFHRFDAGKWPQRRRTQWGTTHRGLKNL